MKPVRLVPAGDVDQSMLDAVRLAVVRQYNVACRDARHSLDLAFAFHPERAQYHSTMIIERLAQIDGTDDIIVGVTGLDLFIPILKYVFGEAQLGGRCAVVSFHRMLQPFYGLPADPELTATRISKTAVHEIGHTLGLTHCDDYDCVMAASHSVEWLDVKGSWLCSTCGKVLSFSPALR
ncbi:MAG TPA: archaemetzincin family Zn-dependent metalloprotease [Thermoanaerobaculia bacterium]|nr:archaemetzincin family Zn-dependent metalloprotease [Thermoanaerobaculia bacterium]